VLKLVTIGGYGYTETSFFAALTAANVELFVDIRQRRGMRGSKYAFLNSQRLQASMARAGIRYLHAKDLAPTSSVRDVQRDVDREASIAKQARTRLSDEFIQAYTRDILAAFDATQFDAIIGATTGVVALFCVESRPEACHRSLVAQKIATERGILLEHLIP
jgi:uncharacterized protein (DUF488 family)